MSTDRELLGLAAKAAGINFHHIDDDGVWWRSSHMSESVYKWNPLTNDGDALRLAVKMDLCITQWRHYKSNPPHVMVGYSTGPTHGSNWIEDYNGNEMEANRRAIVCAVAEIGRVMP